MAIAEVPDDLSRYYAEQGYGEITADMPAVFAEREQAKLALLEPYMGGGAITELGPGPGWFARVASEHGYRPTAIEMDKQYCLRLRHLGVHAINSADPAAVLPTLEPSDAVVLWHVIEHLAEPWEVLRRCAENLRPGGVLAVSTPNPSSLQFRLLRGRWVHVDAPRHLQLIPLRTLVRRLAGHGLRHVRTVTDDPVGLELNRMGWEHMLRRHPTEPTASALCVRASVCLQRLMEPIERRGVVGAGYTVLLTRPRSDNFRARWAHGERAA
ncbi:MAG: class I SAM-dependent methyltransferase [Solirubrobacterales bacterium]